MLFIIKCCYYNNNYVIIVEKTVIYFYFRSFAHLRAIFQEYAKISEKDIEDVIKSEMSGDIKKGMLTVGTYSN